MNNRQALAAIEVIAPGGCRKAKTSRPYSKTYYLDTVLFAHHFHPFKDHLTYGVGCAFGCGLRNLKKACVGEPYGDV